MASLSTADMWHPPSDSSPAPPVGDVQDFALLFDPDYWPLQPPFPTFDGDQPLVFDFPPRAAVMQVSVPERP